MTNFVDGVAMALPWAGGLVPATLTYQNLQVAGLEWWQAGVVAAVVEGMGFVTVTTVIDIYEHNRAEQAVAQENSWNGSRPVFDGAFWIALGGAALYLLAVLVINTVLDGAASPAKLVTGGLLSTFGVLGGAMVALRNQLTKRRDALALAESRKRQAEADREAHARGERERQAQLQNEREREALAHQRALQAEELRMKHELNLRKLEEKAKKNAAKLPEVSRELPGLPETSAKVAESVPAHPETWKKWTDWRKLPESEKKLIATFETPEQVAELYGVSLKTGGNWLASAKKKYPMEAA
jgi:uncharacterized membrane protein